jgi:hypothetical protein
MGATNLAAGISGGTKTLDTIAIGAVALSGPNAITGVGTGILNQELYRPDLASGEHPLTLASNEGFVVQWGPTALATGTALATLELHWLEALPLSV